MRVCAPVLMNGKKRLCCPLYKQGCAIPSCWTATFHFTFIRFCIWIYIFIHDQRLLLPKFSMMWSANLLKFAVTVTPVHMCASFTLLRFSSYTFKLSWLICRLYYTKYALCFCIFYGPFMAVIFSTNAVNSNCIPFFSHKATICTILN